MFIYKTHNFANRNDTQFIIMKRFILSISLSLAAALSVCAGDYDYLVFVKTSSPAQAVTALGTTITFADGNMQVVSNGETTTIPLSEISEMYFSSTSGISDLNVASDDITVGVYTPSGQLVTTFQSIDDVKKQLPRGMYIIRQNGETRKIVVK